MDYILTVAVSMSSGVAQIVSAFPALMPYRVAIAVALVVPRDVDQPARRARVGHASFAVPTYFFIGIMYLTVGTALVPLLRGHARHGGRPAADRTPCRRTSPAISLFLLLHAFSSGTTALTGVEAISNGITGLQGAAQPQRRDHARCGCP